MGGKGCIIHYIENYEYNKVGHDTLEDEFCSDEKCHEKATTSSDKDVTRWIFNMSHMVRLSENVVEEKLLSVGLEIEEIEPAQVKNGMSKVIVKIKSADK